MLKKLQSQEAGLASGSRHIHLYINALHPSSCRDQRLHLLQFCFRGDFTHNGHNPVFDFHRKLIAGELTIQVFLNLIG